jgi:hypothetical protein
MTKADTQPRKGDIVLFCKHATKVPQPPLHWWRTSIGFLRPDGSSAVARWVAACDRCFERSGGDPMNVPIVGDTVWDESDDDIIFEKKS